MIFAPALTRAILAGRKTQTRRPVKGDRPCTYKAGKAYAVQPGRGKPATFRIMVLDVQQALAGDLTLQDARAEGFRTTAEFAAAWVRIHDKAWVQTWFPAADEDDRDLCVRFTERHAHRPVWVITFKVDDTHTPRFLAARPCPDYTTSSHLAAAGEPEAVSEAEQDEITRQADLDHQHWRVAERRNYDLERRLLSQEGRVRAAMGKARMQQVDVSRELWMLRTMQANGRQSEMVERRLEVLERKAFGATPA